MTTYLLLTMILLSMILDITTSILLTSTIFLLSNGLSPGLIFVTSTIEGFWRCSKCPPPGPSWEVAREVDVRLPGKGNSNFHGARPVHLVITVIKWIRAKRFSIKNSFFLGKSGGKEWPKVRESDLEIEGSKWPRAIICCCRRRSSRFSYKAPPPKGKAEAAVSFSPSPSPNVRQSDRMTKRPLIG